MMRSVYACQSKTIKLKCERPKVLEIGAADYGERNNLKLNVLRTSELEERQIYKCSKMAVVNEITHTGEQIVV